MSEVVIDLKHVEYVYSDGTRALNGVSLKVLKAERVAILGPNGAGKSTLIMHLNGLFTPTRGSVEVFGVPIEKNVGEVRKRIGVVFQDPDNQLFCPTLWEDIAFGPLNMGLPDEEVEKRVKEVLKIVGLDGYEDKPPHHLSAGEKKKAAIATVLAMKPEILVLDEPAANLDPKSRYELIEFLNKLHRNQGVTLVLATHDVDLTSILADRVYVLNKGKIVAEGLTSEILLNSKLMSEANLGLPANSQFNAKSPY